MDEATQILMEILRQINELSGAGLDALEQGIPGGTEPGPEGGPPPEGPPPEGPPPGA